MDHDYISYRAYSVDDHRQSCRRIPGVKPERTIAVVKTKEAFWLIVLFTSLGAWAAAWTAAASLASAWLQ